ncbi:MAG: beta strand repeat-containing protein [Chthoniobacteraceae bacterium]
MKISLKKFVLGIVSISAALSHGYATTVTYYWDASGAATGTGSITNGAGTWSTSSVNWLASGGSADQAWANSTTSASTSAVIGTGTTTTSNSTITLSGSIGVNTLTFATSGYTLTGGTLGLKFDGGSNNFSNGITLTVNSGVAATINSYIVGSYVAMSASSGATLTLGGGGSFSSLGLIGSGTFNIVSGTYTMGVFQTGANVTQGASTINASGNSIISPSTSGAITSSTYTINSKDAVLSVAGSIMLGRNGKTGTLDLVQGTVTAGSIQINVDSSSSGYLKVEGGSLTTTGTVFIGANGTGANIVGAVSLSGGSMSAAGFLFGNATTSYNANTVGSLTVTGGTLSIGSGGIQKNTYTQQTVKISLSGGVVAATADWSSAMDMTLTSTNGNITFQAADSLATAHNITLSGVLSGTGGLQKTGAGTLSLNGINTYTGATTVSAGELDVNGSLSASSAVSVGSNAILGGSGTISGLVTVNNGTINGSTLGLGATTLYGTSALSGHNIASSVTVASGTTSLSGTTKSTSTLSVAAGATLNANGTIDGSATVSGLLKGNSTVTGNLTLTSGTLASDNSPGITTVQGNFTTDASSTLVAEVSGAVAGTSYDQVKVSGGVTLAGTLDLTALSGLTLGTRITLIDNTGSGTTKGYFATIITSGSTYTITSNSNYTLTVSGTEYLLSYTSDADGDGYNNDVTLTVVPEPSTWALLLGGLGSVGFGQRIRRRCRSMR